MSAHAPNVDVAVGVAAADIAASAIVQLGVDAGRAEPDLLDSMPLRLRLEED